MVGVYVHLTDADLDDNLLKISGVEVKEKPKIPSLRDVDCPRCMIGRLKWKTWKKMIRAL